jgi:quinol monooxygenase YgiN
MVGLEIMVRVTPEKRQEFLQTFKLLSRADRRDSACLGHRLFEKVSEPNRFLWVEHWTNSKTVEAYLQTDRFRTLLGAMDVLGNLEHLRLVRLKPIPQDKPNIS